MSCFNLKVTAIFEEAQTVVTVGRDHWVLPLDSQTYITKQK